jgi:calcineurin-like phosphoesterase family protein
VRFFTSDTHFGHANIIKFCDRPFRDVDHMDEQLIGNWNSIVQPEDTVWHLGDVALGPRERWASRLGRLNGHIFLVPGNHDRCSPVMAKNQARQYNEGMAYLQYGFQMVMDEVELVNVRNPVNPHTPAVSVVLSHYPFRGYERANDHREFEGAPLDVGKPLIHGHTHSTERESCSEHGTPMLHVGVDAWDYHPVPETEVIEWLAREHLL